VFSNSFLATAATRRPSSALLDVSCENACWTPRPTEHHLFDFSALSSSNFTGSPCATTLRELIR
jgi:hypothetical protein